jgi:hypothetical protein
VSARRAERASTAPVRVLAARNYALFSSESVLFLKSYASFSKCYAPFSSEDVCFLQSYALFSKCYAAFSFRNAQQEKRSVSFGRENATEASGETPGIRGDRRKVRASHPYFWRKGPEDEMKGVGKTMKGLDGIGIGSPT